MKFLTSPAIHPQAELLTAKTPKNYSVRVNYEMAPFPNQPASARWSDGASHLPDRAVSPIGRPIRLRLRNRAGR